MAPVLKKKQRKPARRQSEPELTWEIARLFPAQGDWSEDEYFALDSNHFVEYSDGYLEFLPMPTIFHQLMRIEYALAGIPEYWIIDPEKELITVLVLKSRQKVYSEFGTFRKGERAASKLLRGFTVDVTTTLSQKP